MHYGYATVGRYAARLLAKEVELSCRIFMNHSNVSDYRSAAKLSTEAAIPGMPDLIINDFRVVLMSVNYGRAAVYGTDRVAIAYGLRSVDIAATGEVGFQLLQSSQVD